MDIHKTPKKVTKSDIHNVLEALIQKVLNRPCGSISNDDKLSDIFNSLEFINIIVTLENIFNIEFEGDIITFKALPTIDDLMNYILQKTNEGDVCQ